MEQAKMTNVSTIGLDRDLLNVPGPVSSGRVRKNELPIWGEWPSTCC